ncbi:hypothetical protein Tco_0871553 [Tanacetum coccineum]
MVALFRVFQTLCKQGDWFSFAKRHAPSLVCIDDNCSSIDDPWPAAGSFNMVDVRHLRAHVIKLRDMPEGVLVLSSLSHVWKSHVCDPVLRGADGNEEPHHDIRPTLQRLLFYYTSAAADTVLPDPTLEDLAVGTPSAKILAKAEASQKRKASTSGATSSHILLVTPIRSATVIPSSGNHGGSSAAPAVEGPGTRGSRGNSIMVDDATAPPVGAAYPEGGVAGNCEFTREEWDAPY